MSMADVDSGGNVAGAVDDATVALEGLAAAWVLGALDALAAAGGDWAPVLTRGHGGAWGLSAEWSVPQHVYLATDAPEAPCAWAFFDPCAPAQLDLDLLGAAVAACRARPGASPLCVAVVAGVSDGEGA
jgi:hypothetical protein